VSDETNEGFPGVQVSTFIRGDQFVFRGEDGTELAAVLKSFEENADDIMTSLGNSKQAVVAKAIFTGESDSSKSGSAAKGNGRSRDKAPPKDDVEFYENEDGVAVASIECKHGPMLDLRDRNYKADLYCSGNFPKSEWKKKCEAVKL